MGASSQEAIELELVLARGTGRSFFDIAVHVELPTPAAARKCVVVADQHPRDVGVGASHVHGSEKCSGPRSIEWSRSANPTTAVIGGTRDSFLIIPVP